jgi:hypothetical protein
LRNWGIVRIRSIFVYQMLELARNHMVLLLGKLCDKNLPPLCFDV